MNRVSLGVQALNDQDLRRLGRLHSAAEALTAVGVAREIFERVSFDLIYARQDQAVQDWEAELAQALALGPDHVSLYQLTIEDGTAFGDRHRRGRLPGLPDEDRAADLYDVTQSLTEAAGLPAYEVSNHARPGAEARHNLLYWESGGLRRDWAGRAWQTDAGRHPVRDSWRPACPRHGSTRPNPGRLSRPRPWRMTTCSRRYC